MELIDDDDVEMIKRQSVDACSIEALHRGEHVLKTFGTLSADPQLAERVVAQGMPERGETLVEDLFAVRHEEQTCSRQGHAKPGVVDSRHDGLTRASCRNEQVAVVALLARDGDQFEESFLEGLEANLDRTEHRDRSSVRASTALDRGVEVGRFVWDEISAVPVAVKTPR